MSVIPQIFVCKITAPQKMSSKFNKRKTRKWTCFPPENQELLLLWDVERLYLVYSSCLVTLWTGHLSNGISCRMSRCNVTACPPVMATAVRDAELQLVKLMGLDRKAFLPSFDNKLLLSQCQKGWTKSSLSEDHQFSSGSL